MKADPFLAYNSKDKSYPWSNAVKFSVILTTFNRPSVLGLVLKALNSQTYKDFEVIIADDGSGEETAQCIKRMQKEAFYKIIHDWQEPNGFRAARGRNLAALKASGDYLIFLDGDCIPRHNFIESHYKLAQKGYMVAGNRCLLNKELTEYLEKTQTDPGKFGFARWICEYCKRRVNRLIPLINLSSINFFRFYNKESWKKVRTCNLGVWMEDFKKVNGFDGLYVGWGYEDSDLAVRLLKTGIKRKSGILATGVLHMWHEKADRASSDDNFKRLQERLHDNTIRAVSGLAELASEKESSIHE